MRFLSVVLFLLSGQLIAGGYWTSSHVSESPHFSTPEEACEWYLDGLGYDLIGIEYYMPNAVKCMGALRDLTRDLNRSGVIGYAAYVSGTWDRINYEAGTAPFCISENHLNSIRESLVSIFGAQAQEWTIGSQTVQLYGKMVSRAQEGCKGLTLLPTPVFLPHMQARSVLLYILKNAYTIYQRQKALNVSSTLHVCLLSSALAFKTEFALAQVDDKALKICSN